MITESELRVTIDIKMYERLFKSLCYNKKWMGILTGWTFKKHKWFKYFKKK